MKVNPRSVVLACWFGIAALLGVLSSYRATLYNDPIAFWRDAYRSEPNSIVVCTALATQLAARGDARGATQYVEQADKLLAEAVTLHPDAGNLNLQGTRRRRARKPEESIAALERAAEFAPSSGPIWNNLGMSLVEAGRPEQAIECFEKAAELLPHDAEVRAGFAVAQLRAGQRDSAIGTANHASQIAADQGDRRLAAQIKSWIDATSPPAN